MIVFDEGEEADLSEDHLASLGGRSWSSVVHEANRAIQEIEGVVSARVRLGVDEVEEVHVVARGPRRAKEIVRDVETLLKAKFDLEVDHRKISVARLGEAAGREVEPELPARVGFQGVSLHLSRDGGEARVELASGGQRWVGTASSRGPESAWPRLVALATLDALSQLLPPDAYLELSDLVSISVADRPTVVVSVHFRRERQTTCLMGCASVDGDEQRSVVYAVLHAVNRFLGRFSGGYPQEILLAPP